MLKNIKAVIFDMDGTLIDSLWVWDKVDIDFLQRRNIELPTDFKQAIEGLSFPDTAKYVKNKFNMIETYEEIMDEWSEMVKEYYTSEIEIKKGVKEFLSYLKINNYKIGIATSNFRSLIKPVLIRNEIFEYFDVIVTTDEVPRDKSFPDVFLETAKRLNIPPQECLVFEDTLCAVLSAKSASMNVVGIYDPHGTYTMDELEAVSDHLIENFESIVTDYCK